MKHSRVFNRRNDYTHPHLGLIQSTSWSCIVDDNTFWNNENSLMTLRRFLRISYSIKTNCKIHAISALVTSRRTVHLWENSLISLDSQSNCKVSNLITLYNIPCRMYLETLWNVQDEVSASSYHNNNLHRSRRSRWIAVQARSSHPLHAKKSSMGRKML